MFNYSLSRNWQVSGNFIYATGRSYTPIKSVFFIDARPNIEYGPRNSARLEDYHRMDLSFIYENVEKLKNHFIQVGLLVFIIFIIGRILFTYTDFESNVFTGNASAKALKVSVFTIIPSVTWNFYWNIKK